MICLAIKVNDTQVCLVGKDQAQRYSAVVSVENKVVELSANGSGATNNKITEIWSWSDHGLSLGDVVSISVVENNHPDEPIRSEKLDHTKDLAELEEKIIKEAARIRLRNETENDTADLAKSNPDALLCGFCQKAQQEVTSMIKGPTVCICNECIDLCNDILKDK